MPLVISQPGAEGRHSRALASSIDLGPTLLDLCDLPGYDGMRGVSLQPVLEDSNQVVRDGVLIEDDIAAITAKLTPIPGKTRTLVTERYRYTRNSKGEEQLFDLQADPDEMLDISSSADAVRARMLEHLVDALIDADDVARGAPVTQNIGELG